MRESLVLKWTRVYGLGTTELECRSESLKLCKKFWRQPIESQLVNECLVRVRLLV